MFQIEDTEFLLTQWARWTLDNSGASGYPEMTTFRRLPGITVPVPSISDDEAVATDRAVSELMQRDPEMAEALITFGVIMGQSQDLTVFVDWGYQKACM